MTGETLTPAQLARQGKGAYQQGNYSQAAGIFNAAQTGYDIVGDQLMAAEMANNACVAYLQAGDPQSALQAVEDTAMVFASKGDIRRQAMALGNMAASLEALNRLGEAEAIYEQCIELLRPTKDDETRLLVIQALSALRLRQGRQLEALATMQAGMDELQHPNLKQRLLKQLLNIPFQTSR